MKKNAINVDIIAFGDLDPTITSKLEKFHENIKGSGEGSHLAIIPPGPNLLSDSIVATPILAGEGMGMGGGGAGGESGTGGGGDSGFDFGIDPNSDPELALALRMSMEEEERAQQRRQRENEEREGKQPLESVPEGEERPEASGSGAAAEESSTPVEKKDDTKDGDPDKMDTA